MRKKKVTRYYCEHCGRGKFKRPDMESHEQHCTRNVNRVCGLCERETLPIVEIATELVTKGESDESLTWLRMKCSDCPSCILSVIQYAGRVLGEWFFYVNEDGTKPAFDYKSERDAFRRERSEWSINNP